MKFKELLTEVQKLGYNKRPTKYHSYKNDDSFCLADIEDEEYHHIEMLLIKDWLRTHKLLDITINAYDDSDDDSGGQFNVYTSNIGILQKNGKCKYQVEMDRSDGMLFSYFECLEYTILESIKYLNKI